MGALRKGLRGLVIAGVFVAAALAVLVLTGIVPLPGRGNARSGASASPGKRAEAQPVAVTLATVTPRSVQRMVTMVGNLYGSEEITITPKVEGRVVRIHQDVGDKVKPGDVLLEIEEIDYRLALAEAQRGLEMELAKLGLTELPAGNLEYASLPTVIRAMAMEENARGKINRARRLGPGVAVTREELDQLHAEHEAARAIKEHAVMEAQALLASARHKQALLQTARQRLAETKVLAPVPSKERRELAEQLAGIVHAPVRANDGRTGGRPVEYVVAQRMVSEGEMVRAFPSVAAFRLVIDRPLKLVGPIPERHSAEVQVGQTVGLKVEAYPKEIFQGTVARVNPIVDRSSRTFLIEVHVANEDRRLKAGSFVKAAVLTPKDNEALTVPEEALVTFAGITKVFVVEDGKARAVPVRLGERLEVKDSGRSSNWVEIVGDLRAGSQVVASGHSQLAEGTPVRIRLTAEKEAGRGKYYPGKQDPHTNPKR